MKAACGCGQLTLTTTGAPLRVSICHCEDCRTLSGSAFSWNLRLRADDVTIAGAEKRWQRRGDEGSVIENWFCPDCGVTVFYRNLNLPDFVMVRAGCLEGQKPAPTISVYDARRPEWLSVSGCDQWT